MKTKSQASTRRPNVLWIMSDQHAAHSLGCYGNADVRTPALDALAAEGAVFENAFCNNPICGPSRCCFLTGQYVPTHGVTGNHILSAPVERSTNVAAHFRLHGYQTGLIGKGHLPQVWVQDGFEYRRLGDTSDVPNGDPLESWYYRHLVENGLGDEWDLGDLFPPHPGADMSAFSSRIPFEHSVERWAGNEALSFLRGRDAARPFFLQLSFQRPHNPISPSFDTPHRYDPKNLTLPDSASEFFDQKFAGKPAYQRDYVNGGRGGYPYRPASREDPQAQLAGYYSLITTIDAEIGRVVEFLRETGELENTIIAYHADHGDFAGEHGLMLKNFGTYESIHRFPLILWHPAGVPKGRHSGLVESVDLAPTFCELAGLPQLPGFDGRPLTTMARGETPFKSEACSVWDFPLMNLGNVLAVRTDTHRLVYYPRFPQDGELYCRESDPDELVNRFHDPELREVRLDLTERLMRHTAAFRRVSGFEKAPEGKGLNFLVARRGLKWSEIARFYPPQNK
jgi:arylsulfatase